MTAKHSADLTGVSETALMTLQVRASEARRPDGIIDDPMAVHLVDSIDVDFGKFGYTKRQDMALRAKVFDKYTRRYLVDHPRATVVALAEGLQTSFYRLDAAGAPVLLLHPAIPAALRPYPRIAVTRLARCVLTLCGPAARGLLI